MPVETGWQGAVTAAVFWIQLMAMKGKYASRKGKNAGVGRFTVKDKPAAASALAYNETNVGANIVGDDLEFIQAVDKYRGKRRIIFLGAVEYLAIARKLGYRKCKST